MDNPATCGQTLTIYENTIILSARATVSNPNPPTSCAVTLNSGYTDSYYYIMIEQIAITIQDCAFVLNFFLGATAGGTPLKSFACQGSETTGRTTAKSSTVTISLTQPRELFQPANTFTLKITTYRDPDAPAIAEGTSNLPTGAIIGIVVALFALIAFAIIMCWCYRQGKLKFLQQEKYDYRASNDTLTHKSMNGSTNIYPESEASRNSPNSIKRHFDLENKEVWASLTNTPTSGRRQPRPVSIPVAPPVPSLGGRLGSEKNDKNWEDSSYTSVDTDNVFMTMQGSPGRSRARSQANGGPDQPPRGRRLRKLDDEDDSVTAVKGRTGSFNNEGFDGDEKTDRELPRGRRPTASARNTKGGEGDDQTGNRGSVHENMLGELKRTLSRRESGREGKGNDGGKETTIDDPAPASKSSPRRSRKDGQVPEAVDTIDKKKYLAMDQQSEIGEGDIITNPLMRNNPAIRASVSSLRSRTDESPGSKRKRRKKKKYVSVQKDPNKSSRETLENSEDSLPEPPSDHYESIPFTTNTDNIPLPPEALAPVFATDQSTMQHYYPNAQDPNAYQQQQSVPVLVGYDANGYPVYSYVNPQMVGTPYVQLGPDGQPVQYDPNYPGYYIDQAGNYIPIADTSQPGMPGYTSMPGHDPAGGYPSGVIAPMGSVNPAGGLAYNSIIPAGNILDDSQLPPPGGTVVRSAVDPATGSQVNQVVWTGVTRDPTDPPPGEDNPQITRKNIARVTTKAHEYGQQPTKPDPVLQQMTLNAANQIKARPNEEPSFLSPSKIKSKDLQQPYVPKPIMNTDSPVSTPFHAKVPRAEPHIISSGPRLRDAPAKSQAFRDKITLSTQDDTDI
ncbi:hypothetical protein FSP39_009150 [Pinctada imbricata]|uniref:Uncharacterized protein n=1 Tax=Pinctada imbricata TaxID=66713 RepID=A0AA88YC52_PINIB|nr:hypothetical protein FSP39_009150 [Pinctada imbricata]